MLKSHHRSKRPITMSLPYCLLPLLLHFIASASGEQKIVREPSDARVAKGSTAILHCQTRDQVGQVQWTKDGFGLGSRRELPGYERYSMTGSSTEGEFNLQITDVQLADEADYRCQLGATREQKGHLSEVAHLTVLVPPRPPVLLQVGDVIAATAGVSRLVACEVEGGRPAPEVSWLLAKKSDGSHVLRKLENETGEIEPTVTSQVSPDGALFNVKSVLRYVAKKDDDGHFLVCVVKHETIADSMHAAAQLNVEYAPEVRLMLNTSYGLKEGFASSAELTCLATAKPAENIRYTFYRDNNVVKTETANPVYIIHGLGREDDGSVIKCEAENAIGSSSAEYLLNVAYAPAVADMTVISSKDAVDRGETMTLSCRAKGNPTPTVKWFRHGNPSTVLVSEKTEKFVNYTINSIQYGQQGIYVCSATTEGFSPVEKNIEVNIKGPPSISLERKFEASEGETMATLICNVKAHPLPEVHWYKNGVQLASSVNSRYGIRHINSGAGQIVKILEISEPKSSDFSEYNCSANNSYGRTSSITRLVSIDVIPLYIMIPGVIGACVVILVVFLLVILLNRRVCCACCACGAKSSQNGDDHSDVTVKVEALDGGVPMADYYPDMYSPPPGETGDYVKTDYMPISQDNPDLDLLPPPYGSYVHAPSSSVYATHYNSNTMPSSFQPQQGYPQGYSNGTLPLSGAGRPSTRRTVQMTYLDGDENRGGLVYADPYGSYGDYPQVAAGEYAYEDFRDVYRQQNYDPRTQGMQAIPETQLYYPSAAGTSGYNGMGQAPMAQLEPVLELPTPEDGPSTGPSPSRHPIGAAGGVPQAAVRPQMAPSTSTFQGPSGSSRVSPLPGGVGVSGSGVRPGSALKKSPSPPGYASMSLNGSGGGSACSGSGSLEVSPGNSSTEPILTGSRSEGDGSTNV